MDFPGRCLKQVNRSELPSNFRPKQKGHLCHWPNIPRHSRPLWVFRFSLREKTLKTSGPLRLLSCCSLRLLLFVPRFEPSPLPAPHYNLSCSCTWLLYPPRAGSPQVTTAPDARMAANAPPVAWMCWTFLSCSCTWLLSPPNSA